MKKYLSSGSVDYVLLGTVILLCVFGLLMLTSAGSPLGFQKFGDSYHFIKQQLISFVIGMTLMVVMMNVDYKSLKKYSVHLLLVSIILLFSVFIPGIGASLLGGSRWISIGGAVFQPSELAKLSFIIYLAAWLESQKGKSGEIAKRSLYQFGILLAIVAGLIIAQPDMGTMSVVAIVAGVVLFSSGVDMKYIFSLIGVGGAIFLLLIKLAPYRLQRLTAFLNPENDIRGIGYHVYQSLIAIGSGGFFGVGLGKSRQKFNYLPEAAADSIFAVIAEELGFLLSTLLVLTFLLLFIRGIRIARRAQDEFGKLLVTGIIAWIVLQAFMNIAALSSLIPLTGIPLPFISYGGSSLIITLAAVGIVLNVSKQGKH